MADKRPSGERPSPTVNAVVLAFNQNNGFQKFGGDQKALILQDFQPKQPNNLIPFDLLELEI
jgi:hypothetical protein